MKNLKLGTKLIGGFTITALIVLIVGITALYEQGRLYHETQTLENDALPAVQAILTIKSEANAIVTLMRTLLTPYATLEQRKAAHEELLEHRKVYGKAKEDFQQLPAFSRVGQAWSQFNSNLGTWASLNNQAVALSQKMIDLDVANPTALVEHMSSFEIAHRTLLENVSKLLYHDSDFTGGTDSHACTLGKWLNAPTTKNPEITKLMDEVRPYHDQLHQSVAQIKKLIQEGNGEQASALLREKLFPLSEQVFEKVHGMERVAEEAYADFTRMNELLLTNATVSQKATFENVDQLLAIVQEVVEEVSAEATAAAKTGRVVTIAGLVVGTVLALGLGVFLTIAITRPLRQGVSLAQAMAGGDMTKTMDVAQKDEIGILAVALNEMTRNLRTMITDLKNGVVQVDDSANQLASVSSQLSSGADNTAARSNQVAAAAEEMSANQDSVAAAMEQASVNVNMVASSAEEMSATIQEIAENSARAKDITTKAVGQSQTASERVNELGRAADEINKVTEVITEISEQTNLLALNATIEAARAGEAGKGFAVVANEIKDLAKQTAHATQDIKEKVQGIHQATGITVSEINEIADVIASVDQIVSTIATAVEEQTATTREIALNVTQVSQGIAEVNENVAQSSSVTSEIAADIAEVNQSANEISQGSSLVQQRADELSSVADKLKTMVAKFIV